MTAANQIAIVGDRLFTDVMMANLMGSWAVWIQDGVVPTRNPVGCSSRSGYGKGVIARANCDC